MIGSIFCNLFLGRNFHKTAADFLVENRLYRLTRQTCDAIIKQSNGNARDFTFTLRDKP